MDDGSYKTDLKCSNCPLATNSRLYTNCMDGFGDEQAEVMFVNLNPTISDDEAGQPFASSSGEIFQQLLRQVDFPKSTYFTNAVKCAPYGDDLKDTIWKRCKGHLRNEIARIKPKVIVALGVKTFRWVSGFGGGGKFKRRGFPCALDPEITVVPFDHPQIMQEATPEDFPLVKSRFVKDLFWLKDAVIDGITYKDDVVTDYKRAKTVDDVKAFLEEFEEDSLVYCDLETSDPNHEGALFPYPENKIAAIGFSARPGHARMIPYECRGLAKYEYWEPEELAEIKELLRAFWDTHVFVGHNFVQFDQKWIAAKWEWPEGKRLRIDCEPQLMSHLLDEEPGCHGLEDLALRYSKMTPWKSTFTVADVLRMCDYLAKDLDAGMRLLPILKEKLNPKQHWLHQNLQLPLAQESREWEQKGVRIDLDNLERADEYLTEAITKAHREINALPEIRAWKFKNGELNLDSPVHIADLLQNYFNVKQIKETDKGAYCADASVLEFYEEDVEFCGMLLKYRRATKLKSTYVDGIKERVQKHGDIINYSIKWHGTVTGRPAGQSPNVFNIPRADTAKKSGIEDPSVVKSIFRSREGHVLLQADYSQAELRTLASFSGDQALVDAYLNDVDVHTATAANLFSVSFEEVTKAQRNAAKCFHPDVEVLTQNGWVKFADYDGSSRVCQAEYQNGKIDLSWTRPTDFWWSTPKDGVLVNLKNSSGINLRVTKDHRMLVYRKNGYAVVTPEEFVRTRYWWSAGNLEGFKVIQERILRLCVATQADGSISPSGAIRYGFTKERKAIRLRKLLVTAGVEFTERVRPINGKTGWFFTVKQMAARKVLQHLDGKSFPWSWIQLTLDLKRVVVDEAQFWDGCTQPHWKHYRYANTDEQSVDVLQAIATTCGRKAYKKRVPTCYSLSIKDHDKTRGENVEYTEFAWEGEVASISVPSTFIVVRDGGIPIVVGQCVNFGIVYGKSERGIAQAFVDAAREKEKQDAKAEGREFNFTKEMEDAAARSGEQALALHKQNHPGVWRYLHKQERLAKTQRYIETPFGRRRRFKETTNRAVRQAFNFQIQSVGSGDITHTAIVRCCKILRELNFKTRPVLTVYDSIIFEVPNSELDEVAPIIKTVMEDLNFDWLRVPMKVDLEVGTHWGNLKDYEAKEL